MKKKLKQFSQFTSFLKLIILVGGVFFFTEITCQEDYSVLITQNQENLSRGKFDIDSNGKAMLFALSTPSNELNFIRYDESKTINKSLCVKFQDNTPSFSNIKWGLNKFNLTCDNAFALTNMNNTAPYLIGLNYSNTMAWSKFIGTSVIEGSINISETDQNLFCSFGQAPNKIQLRIFDFDGIELISKMFGFDIDKGIIVSGSVQKVLEIDSKLLIAISFRVDDPDISGIGGIIKCDKTGYIMDQVFFNNVQIKDIDVHDNMSIYLSMGSVEENNDTSDGQIIQLNESFEVVRSLNIHADNFVAREIILDIKTDELVLIYSTFGSFPVILAKLDLDGSINYQTGLSNYSPDLDIDADGNIYVTSDLEAQENGSLDSKLVSTKFSDIEKIENCPNYTSCLVISDTNYEIVEVAIETSNTDTLRNVDIEVEEREVQLESYCQELQPPEALFDFPTSVCKMDSLIPGNLKNVLSNYVNWELTDPNGNVTTVEELEPTFFFYEIGTFNVRQNIWYLGCRESFDVDIEVADLDSVSYKIDESCLSVSPTSIIIDDIDQTLTYDWSTGETTSTIDVFNSGMYSVTISQGACVNTLNFNIQKTNLSQEDFLSFTPIDSICFEELPYELVPNSIADNQFSMNDNPETLDKFMLENFGKYTIKTIYEDCTIEKVFELLEKECEPKLYIPSAFSPNGDGINDQFTYFLYDQDLVSFQVYSRWGSLVFETSDRNKFWDGTSNGQYLESDTFVYILELKMGDKTEIKTGDFVLMK